MTLFEIRTPRAVGGPERGVVSYFLKNGKPVGVTPTLASPLTCLRARWVKLPWRFMLFSTGQSSTIRFIRI